MEEPATFNRGHCRHDYILCSVPLLPTVTACGILPFNILMSSDHCTVFVDFDTTMLFDSLPSELASCNDPQFKSRDYESSEHYVLAMHIYCHKNNVYRMAEHVTVSANEMTLNKLNDAVGHTMSAGLQAVKKRYWTPFSPEMGQNRLTYDPIQNGSEEIQTLNRSHKSSGSLRLIPLLRPTNKNVIFY
jgi:hypothetical protein